MDTPQNIPEEQDLEQVLNALLAETQHIEQASNILGAQVNSLEKDVIDLERGVDHSEFEIERHINEGNRELLADIRELEMESEA